jgi:hypothetical protein
MDEELHGGIPALSAFRAYHTEAREPPQPGNHRSLGTTAHLDACV